MTQNIALAAKFETEAQRWESMAYKNYIEAEKHAKRGYPHWALRTEKHGNHYARIADNNYKLAYFHRTGIMRFK